MIYPIKSLLIVYEECKNFFVNMYSSFCNSSKLKYCISVASTFSKSHLAVREMAFYDWSNPVVDEVKQDFSSMRNQTYCTKVRTVLSTGYFWNCDDTDEDVHPVLYILFISLVIIWIPFSPSVCRNSAGILSAPVALLLDTPLARA